MRAHARSSTKIHKYVVIFDGILLLNTNDVSSYTVSNHCLSFVKLYKRYLASCTPMRAVGDAFAQKSNGLFLGTGE